MEENKPEEQKNPDIDKKEEIIKQEEAKKEQSESKEEPLKKEKLEKKDEQEKKEEQVKKDESEKKEEQEKKEDINKLEEQEKKEEENIPSLTLEEQNELYEKIISYMGGPNIDENGEIKDISYANWVQKNEAMKHLCEAYEVIYSTDDKDIIKINNIIKNNYINSDDNKNLLNPSGIIENHDFACELKLLKWITEDEKHKNDFISLNFNTEIKLNQYNDILPYKYNIVNPDINNKEEININNYINASFITSPLNNKQKIIIATQTPLKDTINSFWKMIYNYKIKLIIMISDTKKEEENINDINNINKSYFPQERGNIINIDISNEKKIKIELIQKEEMIPQIADLKIFKINDEYELKHIQIISWGNKSLPGDILISNVLIEKLYKNFKDQIKNDNPVVIHCYDGVGRTGTLISLFLILMCLEQLKIIKKEPIMGVFNVVRKLREQRYSSVTDIEHYKFIYDFALYWIRKNYPLKN